MQFLRTVFWVVVAVLGVMFAMANNEVVEINLGAFIWSPPLWFPVLCAFCLGLIPTWLFHRATRWSLIRKLDAANRNLTETRTMNDPPRYDSVPPGGTPMAPPPGVA